MPPHLLLTEREYEEKENWSERKEFHLRKPLIILAGLPNEAGFAILPYVRKRASFSLVIERMEPNTLKVGRFQAVFF